MDIQLQCHALNLSQLYFDQTRPLEVLADKHPLQMMQKIPIAQGGHFQLNKIYEKKNGYNYNISYKLVDPKNQTFAAEANLRDLIQSTVSFGNTQTAVPTDGGDDDPQSKDTFLT